MIALLARQLDRLSANIKLCMWLLLLGTMLALGAVQLQQGAKLQSDILAMLPTLQQDALTQAAIDRVEQQLSDRIYIGLVADTQAHAIDAAKRLMQALAQHPDSFTDISSANIDSANAFNHFYFAHRFKLLTDQQRNLLSQGQLDRLEQQALAQLYNAFGYANSALLSQDPLLLYPANLQALAPSQQLQSAQGILLSTQQEASGNTRYGAIVMAKGLGSVFNPNAQQQQIAALDASLNQLSMTGDIEVLKAGALLHASAATIQAKQEISTLGAASLIGVITLVWLAFRSIFPLVIASLTIATSLLFACVTTLSVFGELHLLTLVFGTSLIGIAIDYSFHFYCERLSQQQAATPAVNAVFPAASLAIVTTVLAYLGIGLTPFPGMQQVAIFCAAGLIGAYLTLLLAYPKLANSPLKPRPSTLALAQRYLTRLTLLHRRLRTKGAAPLALIMALLCLWGLLQLTTDDDIRNLQQSPLEVVQQEQRLRQLLSGGTDNQFILVRAHGEQPLLQQLEQLAEPLKQLQQRGVIGNAINLASYLPSHQKQQQAYQLQGLIYQDIEAVLGRLGLDLGLAPSLRQQYLDSASLLIEPDAFLASPAGISLAPLWLSPSGTDPTPQYGAIVLLGGITDLATLQASIAPFTQVELVDKVADISSLMAKYRGLTLTLLALALVLAALIFSRRFGIKLALWVTAVPALAALLTLATLGLLGSPLTLFHALALILVFGIGVDYSLFFAETQQGKGVMMAVFMSACSTLMAFGLLAFSHTPAIHYFGLTLLLGIAFTFVLAPLIYTFTRTDK